ncbi:hypothetical protein VTN77DRAFT_4793 [Rasamsonia byssochlamydoides]|uniref:uncharacterized protein n=1 Tax=Rasamsonia byssochlamydoides TaxID=89139 RepID=UPI003744984C
MAIDPHPICIYDYDTSDKKKTDDCVDYLTRIARRKDQGIFVVPWGRDTLTGETVPASVDGCKLNLRPLNDTDNPPAHYLQSRKNLQYIGEGQATMNIYKSCNDKINTIPSAMAIISNPTMEGQLKASFASKDPFAKLALPKPTILVLYRDTGKLGGAYPELDSDTQGIIDIAEAIAKLPKGENDTSLSVVLCGNSDAIKDTKGNVYPSIGPYWLNLPTDTQEPKRDVEAYFLKWAYETGYFQMVVGFRSGVLDLFTFLGIPTVSIGLRNMVGELRHNYLAGDTFKRVNVEYDQPRHRATAWIKLNEDVIFLTSPFWTGSPPTGIAERTPSPEQKQKMLEEGPGPLAPFDKAVLETGLRMACHKYLKWDDTVRPLVPTENAAIVTTKVTRSCCPRDMENDQMERYFKEVKALDDTDLMNRKKREDELQETNALYEKYYRSDFEKDWALIKALRSPEEKKTD